MVLACVQDIRVAIQEIQTQSGQAEFCPNETRKKMSQASKKGDYSRRPPRKTNPGPVQERVCVDANINIWIERTNSNQHDLGA